MKNALLLSLMSSVLLSASALACDTWDLNCDGRIDYEEGLKSTQDYREQRKSVSRGAPREGLPDPVDAGYPAVAENPNLGSWKQVSNSLIYWKNAGAYAVMLSPGAQGHSCAKGQKGLIAYQTTERVKECHTMGSEGGIPKCVYEVWVDKVTTSTEKGYKAECQ